MSYFQTFLDMGPFCQEKVLIKPNIFGGNHEIDLHFAF